MSAYSRTVNELVRLKVEWKREADNTSVEGDRKWMNGVSFGIKIALDTIKRNRSKSPFDRR